MPTGWQASPRRSSDAPAARDAHPRRLRGRRADRHRPRRRRGGAGPHRDPRLPPPQRLPGHRSGAGASAARCTPNRRRRAACHEADRRRAVRGAHHHPPRPRRGPALRAGRHHRWPPCPPTPTTVAALVAREPGVAAGVDVALLVLDEVLGPDGYRVLDRVEDGTRLDAGEALLRLRGTDPRAADRRAHAAEPGLPPVRDRHRDRGLGGRRRGHRAPRSATPARPCPVCGRCRSTRCASAAGSTTGWVSATPR